MQQGQWVQCPACRQATAPGYVCQRCGASMQAMMGPPPMGGMPYAQPQKSGMGALGIVMILIGVFVFLGAVVAIGAFVWLGSRASDSSSYSTPYSSPATTTTPTATKPAGPYSDAVGRYSVDFPGDPKLESSTDDTELGKVTLHEAKYEQNKNFVFAVNYTDFPISGRAFSTDGALDGAVNGAAKSESGGSIVYSNKIKLGKVSGRDFQVKVPDPGTPFRICSRVYQDGARQYQVLVLVSEAQYLTNKTDIDDFLESFKIL